MVSEIIIRTAILEDVEAILDIERDAGQRFRNIDLSWVADLPGVTVASVTPHIHSLGVLIAEDTKTSKALGFIVLTLMDKGAFIIEISTRLEASGRGVGQQLMDTADKWAKERSLPYIALTTFEKVPFNGPWYKRLGYSAIEPNKTHPELADAIHGERESILGQEPRAAMIKWLERS